MALLALSLSACGSAPDVPARAPQAPAYVVTAPVLDDGPSAMAISGTVEAAQPIEAAAAVSGRIIRIDAQVGERVAAGQVIAVLDVRAAAARREQAQADLRRAEALAQERERNARRMAAMATGGAVAPAEAESAQADAKAARAAAQAAQAAAAAAGHDADQGVVRAPVGGIVAQRLVELGAVVSPGQKLALLDGSGPRVILASVPQAMADALRAGRTLTYTAGESHGRATVIGLAERVNLGSVVTVRLRIDSGAPRPGSIVMLRPLADGSTAQAPAAVRIPAGAVTLDARRQAYVYVVGRNDRVQRRAVRVMALAGNDARVAGEVNPGETVIAAGGALLSPGQRVIPTRASL